MLVYSQHNKVMITKSHLQYMFIMYSLMLITSTKTWYWVFTQIAICVCLSFETNFVLYVYCILFLMYGSFNSARTRAWVECSLILQYVRVNVRFLNTFFSCLLHHFFSSCNFNFSFINPLVKLFYNFFFLWADVMFM